MHYSPGSRNPELGTGISLYKSFIKKGGLLPIRFITTLLFPGSHVVFSRHVVTTQGRCVRIISIVSINNNRLESDWLALVATTPIPLPSQWHRPRVLNKRSRRLHPKGYYKASHLLTLPCFVVPFCFYPCLRPATTRAPAMAQDRRYPSRRLLLEPISRVHTSWRDNIDKPLPCGGDVGPLCCPME